jgi:hypothetical protein
MGSEPDLVASSKGETEVVGGEEIFKNDNGMMELVPTAPEMKTPEGTPVTIPDDLDKKKK